MKMDEGLDTGDVYKVSTIDISETMTTGELHDELMKLGLSTLLEVLKCDDLSMHPLAKQEGEFSYASKITKDMALIDWKKSVREVLLQIRGLNPYPAAYTTIDDKRLKIFEASYYSADIDESGKIVDVGRDYFLVACLDGLIKVTELQLTGKKRMKTGDFLRGYEIRKGSFLC